MVGRDQLVDSLTLGGPIFQAYSSKVDGTIAVAVAKSYGQSVMLTEPIMLQPTINRLAEECQRSLFSFQSRATAICTLLNFCENSKLQKHSHLLMFYHFMVLYSFMLLARMRCNKNFAWWGVVNACIHYGS
jgi:hypothetical protein